MLKLTDYVKANPNFGKVLYYPGAGDDFSALRIFGPESSIDTFIFTDYMDEKYYRKLRKENICEIESEEPVFPQDFNRKRWEEFWPVESSVDNVFEFSDPDRAFGVKMILFFEGTQKRVTFYYLCTEGIQTYKVICDNGLKPDVLLLQEHGTGGNWSFFGYQEDEYKTTLYDIVKDNLPKCILVQPKGNTNVWPGYEQICEEEYVRGPMNQNERAIFERKKA